jgi:hypothetical protein
MLSEVIRNFVFYRDTWHCRHCFNANGLDPHHVIFKSAGGTDTPNNLLTLCRKCHDDIHGGRLKIEVVEILEHNLMVKFWKQKGWKP